MATGNTCGVGGWGGPLPGDPSNDSILSATPAFGGIDVTWTYPATNPQAVAYTKLYRALIGEFSAAILWAEVAGSFYYDKIPSATRYYYWIQSVSVNGTVGELIGPASAVAKPTIEAMIEILTGQIDDGFLAMSLKTQIDRIGTIALELAGEVVSRQNGEITLSQAMADVNAGVAQALTFLASEQTSRVNGDSALAESLNLIAVTWNDNLAAVQTTLSAEIAVVDGRVTTTANSVTQVAAQAADNLALVNSSLTAEIAAVDGRVDTLSSMVDTVQASSALTLRIASQGYDATLVAYGDAGLWNGNVALGVSPLRWGLHTLNAVGGIATSATYDLLNDPEPAGNAFAAALNAIPDYTVVIINTFDYPGLNTLSVTTREAVITALGRCGATRTVLERVIGRSAYILVGIAGGGQGTGAEKMAAPSQSCWIELHQQFVGGRPVGLVGGAAVPALSAAVQAEITARTNADNALASSISTVESQAGTNLAQAQTTLQTNINTVDGKAIAIGALYTAQVNVNGLIGGFGVYNDGSSVEAGFDVDKFWIGRTSGDKRKPFIIDGGVVYIDEAAVNKLTFSKLRDESGNFIVSGGKVQAAYLKVSTASIDDLAVTTGKIDNLAVTTGKIGNLQVDTLQLAGNAVTIPITGSNAGSARTVTSVGSKTTSVTIGSITTSAQGAGRVTLSLSPNGLSSQAQWWIYSYLMAECSTTDIGGTLQITFAVKRNGTAIWTQSTTNSVGGSTTSTRFMHAPVILDTPGAGVACVYTLEIFSSTSAGATNHAHEIIPFTFTLTESKR